MPKESQASYTDKFKKMAVNLMDSAGISEVKKSKPKRGVMKTAAKKSVATVKRKAAASAKKMSGAAGKVLSVKPSTAKRHSARLSGAASRGKKSTRSSVSRAGSSSTPRQTAA